MKNRKIFNKLVRDKIPEILKRKNANPEIEILDDSIYFEKLNEKLLEECNEVIEASNKNSKIEEIADVLEVIMAMAKVLNVSFEYIENIRLKKLHNRGGFEKKVFLKSAFLLNKLDN